MSFLGINIEGLNPEKLHPVIHHDFKRIENGWHANLGFIEQSKSGELPGMSLDFEFSDDQVFSLFEHFPYSAKIKELSPDKYTGTLYYVGDEEEINKKKAMDFLTLQGIKHEGGEPIKIPDIPAEQNKAA